MPRARLQAAWAHARRAEQELAALVEEEEAYNGLPDDLPGAYIQLRREHEALRAKYEEEREAWLAFKAWWRSRVRERRAIKRAQPEPDEVPEAQGSTPSTPRKRRTEITSPVRSPIPTPRRSRERVLQHRTHVRQLLQENPALFKGNGRYADAAPRAPRAPASAPARSRRQMHAADCACCRDVRLWPNTVLRSRRPPSEARGAAEPQRRRTEKCTRTPPGLFTTPAHGRAGSHTARLLVRTPTHPGNSIFPAPRKPPKSIAAHGRTKWRLP